MNKRVCGSIAIVILIGLAAVFTYYSDCLASSPAVTSGDVHIDDNSVIIEGMIADDGGTEITRCGFTWGTSSNLEESIDSAKNGGNSKRFAVTVDDLQDGTTYYYRAFAENSKGLSVGEIKNFTIPRKDRSAPVISMVNPEDNTAFTRGESVKISAQATDDIKVEGMKLFIGDEIQASSEEGALTYEWDTSEISPGSYTLKVTAADSVQASETEITLYVKNKIVVADTGKESQVVRSTTSSTSDSTNISETSAPVSRSTPATDYSKYPKVSKWNGIYGQFNYRDISGGRIEIDPWWIAQNIVTITLPGLNQQVQVHREAADNFIKAFTYIKNGTATINGKQVPLLSLIETMDGTFVTRHVYWDSSRGLSNHSWGTAIDINASGHFGYVDPNKTPNDPNLILWEKAFKPAGFSWGNSYSDSMHFELLP